MRLGYAPYILGVKRFYASSCSAGCTRHGAWAPGRGGRARGAGLRRPVRESRSVAKEKGDTWLAENLIGTGPNFRMTDTPPEIAEMVRYAVGYQSRAFVTFGTPRFTTDFRNL